MIKERPWVGELRSQFPAANEYAFFDIAYENCGARFQEEAAASFLNAPQSSPGIGAAQFLCSFAEDVPMISIDTGRMPFNSRVYDGHPAGATGFGVQTLYWYAKKRKD